MATARNRYTRPVRVIQRDPGPWSWLLIGWLATLGIILVFGLVMLFSASYTTGYLRMGNSYYYIRQQTLCAGLGLFVMLAFSYIDYRWLRKMVWPGYLVSIGLLIAVFFFEPLNGCRRWINIRGLPTIQASELVKFEMILLMAHLICNTPRLRRARGKKLPLPSQLFQRLVRLPSRLFQWLVREPLVRLPSRLFRWLVRKLLVPLLSWLFQRLGRELLVPLLPLVPVVVLLFFEPHMSGIVLMCAIVGTMLLLGGNGGVLTYIGAAAGGFLIEFALEHIDSIPYLQTRLDGWTQDLEKMTDQTLQSLYAIGSGGLTGLGLGNSVEKQLWLPECTNDFIFSVVCEELGFVGAMMVIVLFVLFIVQGLVIAFEAADLYGTLVGVGIMAQIAWQVFCNIAVVTNTLPNTGISLPFFSSGGTSLILLLAEMGVMVNIGRNGARAKSARRAQEAEQKRRAGNICKTLPVTVISANRLLK